MMNGSEQTRTTADIAGMIRDAVRGRIRFAGFAYLASASMILTLVAGAFITSQNNVNSQSAVGAAIQPAFIDVPAPDEDATDDPETDGPASQGPPPAAEPSANPGPATAPAPARPIARAKTV